MANILYRGAAVPSSTNTAGANAAPLTNDQIDKNLYALNTDKLDKATATAQTITSDVTFSGNVTISGTTTTINTVDLALVDKNIELGKVASPTDVTANGGGITLKGTTDKTLTWDSANSNWTSSEHWNIANTKVFKINNVSVLSATALGTNVVNSSLTKLGTAAGLVKSDASGNLTVDTSTYSVTSHGHFVGTTAVQASSANQALAGITSISGGTGNTSITLSTSGNAGATGALSISTGAATAAGDAGAISITAGDGFGVGDGGAISITAGNGGAAANGNGGNVDIKTGNGTTTSGTLTIATGTAVGAGNINVKPGTATYAAVDFAGGVTISGGNTTGSGASINAGNVSISGGSNTAVAGIGGNVTLEGGSGVTTKGSVIIGSGANTAAIGIGSSSNTTTVNGTVKLANVGTSGFVKLGAGGQLSSDTTAYLSGTVAIANGGTNITSYAAGDILYASAANVLSKLAKGSDGQVLKLASGFPAWGTDNDNDTTYSVITAAEITTGTATALRTISGAAAKLIADRNVATVAPLAHGTAAVGTSLLYARQDHVHPSDNTDTDTITRLRGTASGTYTSGDLTLAAGSNVTVTQSGSTYTIASSYTDTDTNTTYSHAAATGTGGANLSLIAGGSGSGTDNVLFKSAGATTVSYTDADTITISSTDTTYSLITEAEITDGTATDSRTISGVRAKYIAERNKSDTAPSAHGTAAIGTSLKYARQDHVHASDNTNTITTIKGGTGTAVSGAVEFAAGTNVSITQAGQVVTINSTYTDTNTNTTYSLDGSQTVINSVNLELIAGGSGSGTDTINVVGAGGNFVSWNDTSQKMTIEGGYSQTGQAIFSTNTKAAFTSAADGGGSSAMIFGSAPGLSGAEYTALSAIVVGDKITVSGMTGTGAPNNQTYEVTGVGLTPSTMVSLIVTPDVVTRATGSSGTTPTITHFKKVISGNSWNGTAIAATLGGTGQTGYAAGDILYASSTTALSKLAKGTDGQVLKLASGVPTWAADNDTDTNTTYSNGTGLALTGTSFSVNYGTTATTACVGNDTRLSDSRAASDVYAWAKASTKPSYAYSEISSTPTIPTTLPASDVYAWAKAATKPSYAINEISSGALTATTGAFSGDVDIGYSTGSTNVNLTLGNSSNTNNPPTSSIIKLGVWAYGTLAKIEFLNIGTASLDLSANSAGSIITFTTTDTGYVKVKGNLASTSSTTGAFIVAGGVGIGGDVYAGGNITSTSDIRVKTNITKIDGALAKVEQLNGYTFDRTDIETPRQTGVIAQEVLKVLPEAVLGSEDTTYSVAYGNMMGLMIEAIKELNAKVVDLQNQLANK